MTTIVLMQRTKTSRKTISLILTKGVAYRNVKEDLGAVLLNGTPAREILLDAGLLKKASGRTELSKDLKIQ
jgi:hypothetical protein